MKRLAAITLLSMIFAPLLMSCSAGATFSGDRESVIIVFHDPVSPEDLKYLEAIGGKIKYTYSIINGVAVDLPIAAVNKLRVMQQNPASPVSDPIAKRISYIEDDGTVYALGDDVATVEKPAAAVLPVAESIARTTADPPHVAFVLPFGDMYTFPVLPLALT